MADAAVVLELVVVVGLGRAEVIYGRFELRGIFLVDQREASQSIWTQIALL